MEKALKGWTKLKMILFVILIRTHLCNSPLTSVLLDVLLEICLPIEAGLALIAGIQFSPSVSLHVQSEVPFPHERGFTQVAPKRPNPQVHQLLVTIAITGRLVPLVATLTTSKVPQAIVHSLMHDVYWK